MTKQTLIQKLGEVNFRHLITQQHLGLEKHFREEYTPTEMLAELKKRIKSTRTDFRKLRNQNINLQPYLEIGAEYGLRSCLLETAFDGRGFALDLARAPLEAMPHFAKQFGFTKFPIRIVADAHELPFSNQTFAFVFCYQTLHHFPDPLPVVKEIWRVLKPGGWFFFSEEPVRQTFNLRLFRRPTKASGWNKLLKYSLLLPFISEIGKSEVDYGIAEEAFSLNLWQKLTREFVDGTITISPFLVGRHLHLTNAQFKSKLELPFTSKFSLTLFGGGISGLLHKNSGVQKTEPKRIFQCPNCHSKLTKINRRLTCLICQNSYMQTNGIWQLLTKDLNRKLYG